MEEMVQSSQPTTSNERAAEDTCASLCTRMTDDETLADKNIKLDEPVIEAASYSERQKYLTLWFRGGAVLAVPRSRLNNLIRGNDRELSKLQIVSSGRAIQWAALGKQVTAAALLCAVLRPIIDTLS